jgi:hypothetical protein
MLQANQRVEEYKRQIKSLTVKLKEVSLIIRNMEAIDISWLLFILIKSLIPKPFLNWISPE